MGRMAELVRSITARKSLYRVTRTLTGRFRGLRRLSSQEQDETTAEQPKQDGDEEAVESDKVKELQDKYMRALAETENVRQRMTKQMQEAKKFGIHGFAKDLLDVADILEKANESVSSADLKSDDKLMIALVDGLKLTEAELHKVLKKNGVTRMDAEGAKFDPALHEALFEVGGDNPGTVAVVSRQGYLLHERTLRPARVGVVKTK